MENLPEILKLISKCGCDISSEQSVTENNRRKCRERYFKFHLAIGDGKVVNELTKGTLET